MIACLGWGSLIWNPGGLPIIDGWLHDGPQLPIEFARISKDGRLTLVIVQGTPAVTVLWAGLSVTSLDDGIHALADRERVTRANIHYSIGYWSQTRSSRHEFVDSIGAWAGEHQLEAVVWTALKPGFLAARGVVPTSAEVLTHLESLKLEDRARAEEYVRRAPAQIRTPYRSVIEQRLGWTHL